jgi:hypothetical protein
VQKEPYDILEEELTIAGCLWQIAKQTKFWLSALSTLKKDNVGTICHACHRKTHPAKCKCQQFYNEALVLFQVAQKITCYPHQVFI